jgi:hypothetical protein
MSEMIDKGLTAKRESKYVEFKQSFDPASAGDWCEIVKDIVAIANSGGGVIIIGLGNTGDPTGDDVSTTLALDNAIVVDKINKYTGYQFTGVEIHEAEKSGHTVAVLEISAIETPLVFQNVGTYEIERGKQKAAFSKGSVYFRHGAKSEPGTMDDIRQVIEKRVEQIRAEWLTGVQKVVKAPAGSTVSVFSGEVRESSSPGAMPIRLVDDPSAPGYRLIDHDMTYPYRQTELIGVVNGMLPEGVNINTYDVLVLRRLHGVDDNARFAHAPKFGSTQYSDAFANWIVTQHKADPQVFEKARTSYYELTHE